jgi:SAM-dependent methyltransferase
MPSEAFAGSQTIACPICSAESFTTLFSKRGESFVRCECGLVLINPRPAMSEVQQTYDGDYSQHYVAKADKKLRRAARWVQRIRKAYVPTGRWLDIGCSAGFVVKAASEQGFDACGVDVEAHAIAYAREALGLEQVYCGALETQSFRDQSFDVISLYDVIEHVPDLNALVAKLSTLLRAGGVIDIRTPDAGHFRVPRDLFRWPEIKPSEHLYYFTFPTLQRLLQKHGLEIVHKRFSLKPGLKVYAQHIDAGVGPRLGPDDA